MFLFSFLTHEKKYPEDTLIAFDAAKGDVKAFEKIVRKYEKYVCTVVFGVVKNREDTFDVAQEVFLKLYHNIGTFKGDSSFSSWLYRIAKNSALDFLRKKKGETAVSLTVESDDGEAAELDVADTSGKFDPEKTAIDNERNKMLYDALDEISEEHKEIILLRDINGYSYTEISDMLSLEEGTVKSRLYRAREALKKNLEKKNYF